MSKMVKSDAHVVNYKVIQSGDVIELIHYEKGYLKDYNINGDSSSEPQCVQDADSDVIFSEVEEISETQEDIYIRSAKRASKTLVRTINSNVNQYGRQYKAKFLTLTFADDIRDLDVANKMFRAFIRRLNYYLTGSLNAHVKYTAVWELTKKNRIHYHVIFYNVPFIKINDIVDIWGNGIAYINAIDKVDNVGIYVAKYMSKPDERYLSDEYRDKKRYFSSKGLKKSVHITKPEVVMDAISLILSSNVNPTYEYEFESDELGLITYKSYIIPWLKLSNILKLGS